MGGVLGGPLQVLASFCSCRFISRWGVSLTIPILLTSCFTAIHWWKMESKGAKCWTWVLVLLQLWPQYRAIRLIYTLVWKGERADNVHANNRENKMTRYNICFICYQQSGDEKGLQEKQDFQERVSSIEPFFEATPQARLSR